MTSSHYISFGQAIRRARKNLDMNQGEFADLLRQEKDESWNQMKVSRTEMGDRDLSFREVMQVVDVLGHNALHGTYELDQILSIADERVQELKTAVLDGILGLESLHETLTNSIT